MRLAELASLLVGSRISGSGNPLIRSITSDSRKVSAGSIFAAVSGTLYDGYNFISDAELRGACAVIVNREARNLSIPRLIVPNVNLALGEVANILCNYPSRKIKLIGITGTNGKTTTSYIIQHILESLGNKCGVLGTIKYYDGNSIIDAPLTTPDAVIFTDYLAKMVKNNCQYAAVEVSSHALDQHRVWPHRFSCAIFTNLSHEHLDYHKDMSAYALAKKKLFDNLPSDSTAVINFDSSHANYFASNLKAQVVGYTIDKHQEFSCQENIVKVTIKTSDLSGQKILLSDKNGDIEFFIPLVGRHNVENCLGAILALESFGISRADILSTLINFSGVPGRLERIESIDGVVSFIDYAHTPAALTSILSLLKPLTRGKLVIVFGCGGDRDRSKRALMAKVAEDFAHSIIVTNDNPRTEDPEQIFSDVRNGFSSLENISFIADRRIAVREAIARSNAGDVVLIAGKGHEDYQIIGNIKYPLDDRKLVRSAFINLGKVLCS